MVNPWSSAPHLAMTSERINMMLNSTINISGKRPKYNKNIILSSVVKYNILRLVINESVLAITRVKSGSLWREVEADTVACAQHRFTQWHTYITPGKKQATHNFVSPFFYQNSPTPFLDDKANDDNDNRFFDVALRWFPSEPRQASMWRHPDHNHRWHRILSENATGKSLASSLHKGRKQKIGITQEKKTGRNLEKNVFFKITRRWNTLVLAQLAGRKRLPTIKYFGWHIDRTEKLTLKMRFSNECRNYFGLENWTYRAIQDEQRLLNLSFYASKYLSTADSCRSYSTSRP